MLSGTVRQSVSLFNALPKPVGARYFANFLQDKIEDSRHNPPASELPNYNHKFERTDDPKNFIKQINNFKAPQHEVHDLADLATPSGNPHKPGRVWGNNMQSTQTYSAYNTTREPTFPKEPELGQLGQGAASVRNFNQFNLSESPIETAFKMSPDHVRAINHESQPLPEDTAPWKSTTFEEHRLAPGHADRRTFHYLMTAGTWAVSLSFVRAAICSTVHFAWIAKDLLSAGTVEVDISHIEPGQNVSVKYRGKPVFIRRRTPEQIAISRKDDVLVSTMKDPELDNQRCQKPEWLVVLGVCTHLGCIPVPDEGNFKGYFCPCHGSHYDLSGRIRLGPAPSNLEVPPHIFVNDTTIKIGV